MPLRLPSLCRSAGPFPPDTACGCRRRRGVSSVTDSNGVAVNAALEADRTDPWRAIYWSAVYIAREASRLEREYSALLARLKLYRSGMWVQ